MRNFVYLAGLAGLLCFASSCDDYSSPVPIDHVSKASIDTAYLGSWRYIPSRQEAMKIDRFDDHRLDVFAFNDREYVTRMFNADGDQILARAYLSRMGFRDFANVQLLDFNAPDYYLYYVRVDADTLWYYPISEEVFPTQYKKSKELRKALEKSIDRQGFFLPPRKYVRVPRKKIF